MVSCFALVAAAVLRLYTHLKSIGFQLVVCRSPTVITERKSVITSKPIIHSNGFDEQYIGPTHLI